MCAAVQAKVVVVHVQLRAERRGQHELGVWPPAVPGKALGASSGEFRTLGAAVPGKDLGVLPSGASCSSFYFFCGFGLLLLLLFLLFCVMCCMCVFLCFMCEDGHEQARARYEEEGYSHETSLLARKREGCMGRPSDARARELGWRNIWVYYTLVGFAGV